jgi:hypothetical protein
LKNTSGSTGSFTKSKSKAKKNLGKTKAKADSSESSSSMCLDITAALFPKEKMPAYTASLRQKQISLEHITSMTMRKMVEETDFLETVRCTHPQARFDQVIAGSI